MNPVRKPSGHNWKIILGQQIRNRNPWQHFCQQITGYFQEKCEDCKGDKAISGQANYI